jgi:hypothetical protein
VQEYPRALQNCLKNPASSDLAGNSNLANNLRILFKNGVEVISDEKNLDFTELGKSFNRDSNIALHLEIQPSTGDIDAIVLCGEKTAKIFNMRLGLDQSLILKGFFYRLFEFSKGKGKVVLCEINRVKYLLKKLWGMAAVNIHNYRDVFDSRFFSQADGGNPVGVEKMALRYLGKFILGN